MFPGYSGRQSGNGWNDRASSNSQYSSFPSFPKKKREKTQADYDEENRIKERRRRQQTQADLQATIEAFKEHRAYKALKDYDSDDSDEPMQRTEVEAICKSTGGSHKMTNRTRVIMNNYSSPREEKKRKRSSSTSSSSSESSRDRRRRRRSRSRDRKRKRSRSRSPKRRNRSRERKRKHKKKRRRYSSSSSSASGSASSDVKVVGEQNGMSKNQRIFKKPNYKPIRANEAGALSVIETYVNDYHRDNENFTYDGVQPRQRSEVVPETFLMPYIVTNDRKDVGKDDRAVPKETDDKKKKNKKDLRFHQAVPNPKKTEDEFRSLPWNDIDDYVKLSQTDGKFQYLHEIAEEKMESERRESAMDEIRRQERVPHEEDKALMEARLNIRDSPRNPGNYMRFLQVQDSVYQRDLRAGTVSGNVTVRNERKLAILNEGIKQCPRDVTLRVEKAKILGEVDPELADKEWSQLTHTFMGNLSLWETYINTLLTDSKMFDMAKIENTFDKCRRNLTGLSNGEIKSHTADPGTKEFLFNLFIRQLKFCVSTGYVERAIASIQASIEYTFFRTVQVQQMKSAARMEAFQEFWESCVPRIGDVGAEGWDHFQPGKYSEAEIRKMETVALEVENGKFAKLKQRVGEQQQMNKYQKYVYLEKGAQRIFCRPQRHAKNFMDNDHNVDFFRYQRFKDLIIHELEGTQIMELLSVFGMQIVGFDPTYPNLNQLATQFGISELQPILPPAGQRILLRIARTMAVRYDYVHMVFSLVHSYIPVLEGSNISKDTALKRFRAFVLRIHARSEGVQKKQKRKKGEESSDDDEEEEPLPCMNEANPMSHIYKNLLQCFAMNATLTSDVLRRNDSIQRAISMVDFLVDGICEAKQEGEQDERMLARHELNLQMTLTLVLLILERSVDCKPEERASVQMTLHDKLINWVFRLLATEAEKAKDKRLVAYMCLDKLARYSPGCFTDEEKQVALFMPACSTLAQCILMWMGALRGGTHDSAYVEDCLEKWKNYQEAPNSTHAGNMVVHTTLLCILQREWTWFHRKKGQLNDALRTHLSNFPASAKSVQIATDMISNSGGVVQYSRRLDAVLGDYGDNQREARRALAHVTVVDKKKKLIQESVKKSEHGNDELQKINGMLSDVLCREAEQLSDPYMWRMTLKKTTSSSVADELYVKAIAQCRWDRQLHLDIMARSDEIRGAQSYNLMEECHLRHMTNIEDVDIYTEMVEHQKAEAEKAKSI